MSEPCPACAACASPDGEIRIIACAHLGERYVHLWEWAEHGYDAEGPMSDEEAYDTHANDLIIAARARGIAGYRDAVLAAMDCSCPACEDPRFGVWYQGVEEVAARADFERRCEDLRLETAEA